MPQRKVQHKGKAKQSTQENEDDVFSKSKTEIIDEEYVTVVDCETNKKYSKRLIQSNWAKYENFDCGDEDEPPKTDDYSSLISNASSDCSHFQFKSEKSWNDDSSLPPSDVFSLDLNILASGLACLPFYKRIGLDEDRLSAEDKARLDKEAEKSLEKYNEILKKLNSGSDSLESDCENDPNKRLLEILNEKMNLNAPESSNLKKESETIKVEEKVDAGVSKNDEKDSKEIEKKSDVTKSTQKQFFGENDENLEDWLDSVLDD